MFYFDGKINLEDGCRFSFNPGHVCLMFIFLMRSEDEGGRSKCKIESNVQLPNCLQILEDLLDGLSGMGPRPDCLTSKRRLAEASFFLLNCLNKGSKK